MNLQILYADTLFLSNFVMNLLSLSLTGSVMHIKPHRGRLYLASFLGGIYAVFAVVFGFPTALQLGVGVVLSVLLVRISLGGDGVGRGFHLRCFLLFYFSSVLLGGGIEALFSVLEGAFGMRTDAMLRPADAVLLIGFCTYFLMRGITGLLSGGGLPKSVSVCISYGGRSVCVPLLVDSGCSLKDPISGRGAILVSIDALRTVFPTELLRAAKSKRIGFPNDPSLAGRCRLLPMRGVGEERLLLAFRPDGVTLLTDNGTLDVWVALHTHAETPFGGCRGLISASLLYGRINEKRKRVCKR